MIGSSVGRVPRLVSCMHFVASTRLTSRSVPRRTLSETVVAPPATVPPIAAASPTSKKAKKAAATASAASTTTAAGSNEQSLRDKLYVLLKHRGFIFPGSEIYGGFASSYDYGPLGVQLKRNVSERWWKDFVLHRRDCVGIDTAIIIHPKVWQVAGHIENFTDALIECRSCHHRQRADHLVEDAGFKLTTPSSNKEAWLAEIEAKVSEHKLKCASCQKHDFAPPREFNLLFNTTYGSTQAAHLRPETAQGIFINFPHILQSTRRKLPFGVGQIGKSFRNEISPGNLLFRAREFEQMELEYFCHPSSSKGHFDDWVNTCWQWLLQYGIKPDSIRRRVYSEDLAHYASATTDIEFKYPFGWGELWGIANRGDFDLRRHEQGSTKNMKYSDQDGKGEAPFWPHVVEPAVGLDRLVLAFLSDAYHEEMVGKEMRTVLKLHPSIAPYKYAVLPLLKNRPVQMEMASKLFDRLVRVTSVDLDVAQGIGRRYRRHDEIGTPYCITVDHDSETTQTVTVRDRDTMTQRRVHIDAIVEEARQLQ